MKAKWKVVVEGESGGPEEMNRLCLVLCIAILILAIILALGSVGLSPHAAIYLW